ncbi:MAG: peptidoglycan-binding protein [Chloracidobacterium sp.]|nr:peptidoglycan-binding protein [Chloracidobacterium sp.]MDW8217337.1 peptidoglycan-binding domain-containing protein [Acidobacteriota bacterium]
MPQWSRTICAKMALIIACLLAGTGFPDQIAPMEAHAEEIARPQKRRTTGARNRRTRRSRAQSTRARNARGRRVTVRNRRGRAARARSRSVRVRRLRGRRIRGRGLRARRGRVARSRSVRGYRVRGRRGRFARRGRSMRRNRATAYAYRTPQVAPYRPPRNLVIPEARTREIQEKLKEAGFYEGEITGRYDERTREAMRNFQRANGIKETGTPTAPALLRLGLTKHTSEAGDTSAPPVQLPPPPPTDTPPPLQ